MGTGVRSLVDRPLEKDVAFPPVNLIHYGFAVKFVSANLGENDRPYQPVNTAGKNNPKTDNAVDPVGERLVNVLSVLWRHKRCGDEVNVAKHKEYNNRHGGTDWWVPVPGFAVEVEMEKTSRDKRVDDGEGVRYQTGHCR